MSEPRCWLFVPADSERKIAKALDSEADAIIFDLEDSVAPGLKSVARDALKHLPARSGGPQWWVRVNPIGSEHHKDDLELIGLADIHGIVLPKAESGADVTELAHRTGSIPVHAIVTETPASLFNLLSYRDPKSPLAAMSWGAEDLSAALGASSKYDETASSASPTSSRVRCASRERLRPECSRSTESSRTSDEQGLRAEAEAARREGFTGKLAIHPAQVPVINAAFTPSEAEAQHAAAIVAAFEAHPDAGVLSVGGKMVDRPHLVQARRILERAQGG